jgi:hypothetical protein
MITLDKRNDELEKKLETSDLPKAVEVLFKDAKKRKRQLMILTISLILDILLTVGLTVVSLRTQQLAIKAENNKDAIYQSCEASNEGRANNRQLWEYILNLPPLEPPTPEREKRIADFRAFVDETFAPRDCDALVSEPNGEK